MIRKVRWVAPMLVVLFILTPVLASALNSENEAAFEKLLNRRGLSLETPSQKPLLRLLIDPKPLIGQKTYIVGLRRSEQPMNIRGAIALMIEFPAFAGPPGTYLVVLKKPSKRDRVFYDCVVKVEDSLMIPTQAFFEGIKEKFRQGIYRDPMIWYTVPFREKEYAIPIVSEVECLQ